MIKKGINIGVVLLILYLALLVARFKMFVDFSILMFYYLQLMGSDFASAVNLLNADFADYMFSFFMFFAAPVFLIYLNKKNRFAHKGGWASVIAVIILFTVLYAPFITNNHPAFQKDISVTRLLPPASCKVICYKKISELGEAGIKGDFLKKQKEVIKNSFDERIVFADSVQALGNKYFIYQGGIREDCDLQQFENENGIIIKTNKVFLLGTDEYGRDVFTRLVYGTRLSLIVGLFATFISLLLGITLGFIAGFGGYGINLTISRFGEMFMAFPLIIFVILTLSLFGNSISTVIFVLGFSGWMGMMKIVKGEVTALRNKDYFVTAGQIGLTKKKLLFNEVLPVISIPVVVNVVFQFGNVILAESALSFLGLGAGQKYASWGSMLQSGQEYLTSGWWLILLPGTLIVITLLTANQIGKNISKYYNPRFY